MKRKQLLTKVLLAVAMLGVGVSSVWADEAALNPVGVFTWTSAPEITYDANATSWTINQGGISGGAIGKYAGPYAIVKFDASDILDGQTLLTATLDFDITAGSYNSSINIAQLSDATFNPATVTTETFVKTATQFQAGDWSTKNTTKSFSYDVKARVAENNVIAFAIYTNTGREQTLSNVKLSLTYSSEEVATYNYSLKAVNESSTEIVTLASGEEYEGVSVTSYFPYMFYNDGTLYSTTESPYSVTLDKDNTTKSVTYAKASSDIVAYLEGEAANAISGENANYSNGKAGYVSGKGTKTITTLPAGIYTATIYLAANGNRSIVIRNTAISDVTTNTIVALPIDKNSGAGVYTSDEFVITEETTIGYSGYTSGSTTNQSADIDYIYITRTGDASVSATITSTGWATLYTPYALDFSEVSGLTAYTATVSGTTVTLNKVSNVPANTGVVLQGAAKTYSIPVIASSETAQGDLTGSATEATACPAASGTYYILTAVAEGVQFNPATSGSIAAGKAYLSIPSTARQLTVVIGGEATGIGASFVNKAAMNNEVYNLQGQRVAQPKKGLYIENGKKVIIK